MGRTPEIDLRDHQTFYNPIINGSMDFWQRGNTVTRIAGQSGRLADRWQQSLSTGVSKSVTFNRSTNLPTGLIHPARFSYEILNNTAVASFPTSEFINPFYHYIEGNFLQPIFGRPMTLGFWLNSSISIAALPISFINNTNAFSYVTTISVSTGWNYYAVTIPWSSNITETGNSFAILMTIGMASGTLYQAPSLNAWVAGQFYSHASGTNWASVAGVTMQLTQIQIRSGEVTEEEMQNTAFQRAGTNYAEELQLCQRYYEKGGFAVGTAPGTGGAINMSAPDIIGNAYFRHDFKVEKRTSPVGHTYNAATGTIDQVRNANGGGTLSSTANATDTTGVTFQAALPSGATLLQYGFTAEAEF